MRLSTQLTVAVALAAGILCAPVKSVTAGQIAFAVDNTETLFSVNLTTLSGLLPIPTASAGAIWESGISSGAARRPFPIPTSRIGCRLHHP
jgi:hypothetical protein